MTEALLVSIITSDGTNNVDSYLSAYDNVTVQPEQTKGVTSYSTKDTVPKAVGIEHVDLHLRFTLPHEIPLDGTIEIQSPLAWRLTGPDISD
jgi:hypothetical protein